MPLSLSQISLSLTDKEFLLVKLKLSKRLSEVLIETDTIGLPINVPANPKNNVIIKGGTRIRKADFPEAYNIASSFDFDINKKVKIAPNITTKAKASIVSIGILSNIFVNASLKFKLFEEKKLS